MKKLSKRIRNTENAFSVERYATSCLQAAQDWCGSQCDSNGSNPYAMGITRDDRYNYFRAIFEG